MKKGKAPSFPWYPKDWLSDTELRMCRASTRGIWADLLSYMWLANDQGQIECTIFKLTQIACCTPADAAGFLLDAEETNFCDFEFLSDFSADVTVLSQICHGECHADVTFLYALVSITNRRMRRSAKRREKDRVRQERRRKKLDSSRHESRKSHAENPQGVTAEKSTPPFPFPSAKKGLSKDKPADPPPDDPPGQPDLPPPGAASRSSHFSDKLPKLRDEILGEAKQLDKMSHNGKQFKVYPFIQQCTNENGHPTAIFETLRGTRVMWDSISDPWPWAKKAFKSKNAKYNEKQSIEEAKQFKVFAVSDPKLKDLLGDIGQ